MAKKVLYIITGILLTLLGLFLSFGILIYSLKEKDNYGFWGWSLTFTMIICGIFLILKSKR
jgi:H+/Cl- antiporter ClcA